MRGLAAVLAVADAPALADAPRIGQLSKDSVWVPTPERLIHRMLQLADTTDRDLVLDLGSGDGRIPIHAAKQFGARAVGVELEANLVEIARRAAAAQGVSERVRFLRQDLYEADLSAATVIALYQFTLGDWQPDESVNSEGRNAYLWVVPAEVRGEWAVEMPGDRFGLRLDQTYQMLSASGERAGKAIHVLGARLRGSEIRFNAFDLDGNSREFIGRVAGERMSGRSGGQGIAPLEWTAKRR